MHRVGEEIRLRLHNLMEETTSIAWTVDGVTVTSGVFTPSKEGNCTVKAMISYPDGSQENLVKIIKVEAGDEQSE